MKIILTCVLIMFCLYSKGQERFVNLELIGNGMVYSINHEWISEQNRNISLGLYLIPFDIEDVVYKGVGLITNYGKLINLKTNFLELGAGLSFFYGYRNLFDVPLGSLYIVGRVAYRVQWSNKIFRISINPVYVISDNLFNYSDPDIQIMIRGDANWRYVIGIAYGINYLKKKKR